MSATTTIKIPTRPRQGEVWLTVNLGLVDDVPAVYEVARSLGFTPELGCRETKAGIEVHLVLHHEQRLPPVTPAWEEFEEAMYTLSDAINPDAVHLMCGAARVAA